jgi:hypothetical protein
MNTEAYNKIYVAQVRAMPDAEIAQKWRFSIHRKPFEPDPVNTGVGKRHDLPYLNINIREAATCRRGFSRFNKAADPDISINSKRIVKKIL